MRKTPVVGTHPTTTHSVPVDSANSGFTGQMSRDDRFQGGRATGRTEHGRVVIHRCELPIAIVLMY